MTFYSGQQLHFHVFDKKSKVLAGGLLFGAIFMVVAMMFLQFIEAKTLAKKRQVQKEYLLTHDVTLQEINFLHRQQQYAASQVFERIGGEQYFQNAKEGEEGFITSIRTKKGGARSLKHTGSIAEKTMETDPDVKKAFESSEYPCYVMSVSNLRSLTHLIDHEEALELGLLIKMPNVAVEYQCST